MVIPGSEKLVKAGFVVLDATTGVILKVIVFQYNPETLVRRLDAAVSAPQLPATHVPGVTAALGTAAAGPMPEPAETVNFTLALDAADKLETGDSVTQQDGLLPAIAALELLLYPQANTFTVWVSGSKRILPVRITEMQVVEQMFDPALNPIRAEVSVSLQVLKGADLASSSRGRALWDAHYAVLQQLSQAFGSGALSALGITGV
jgi:hypothetical protein